MVIHKMHCCSVVSNLNDSSTFGWPNKVLLLSRRNTQLLPDRSASTLLLLSMRLHLGCIMQIIPHRDIDMWDVFE